MARYLLLSVCILALAMSAAAQTKLVAVIDCNNADPLHIIAVPDREGFSYQINQNKCKWTKGSDLEGIEPGEVFNVVFVDTRGARVRTDHTQVTRYTNGDRVFATGTGSYDSKAMSSTGKWSYTGGTGKFRGLKGSGSYVCKSKGAEPNSGYTCDVEGEYALPAAGK